MTIAELIIQLQLYKNQNAKVTYELSGQDEVQDLLDFELSSDTSEDDYITIFIATEVEE